MVLRHELSCLQPKLSFMSLPSSSVLLKVVGSSGPGSCFQEPRNFAYGSAAALGEFCARAKVPHTHRHKQPSTNNARRIFTSFLSSEGLRGNEWTVRPGNAGVKSCPCGHPQAIASNLGKAFRAWLPIPRARCDETFTTCSVTVTGASASNVCSRFEDDC